MKIVPPGQNWRTNAQRGLYYVREFRGVTVVSAWPKKRGAPRSEAERLAQEKFAEANLMTKYVDPAETADINHITAGTMYMPRDLLISQMYGRFWNLALVDGTVLYPMATRIDISQLLDALEQREGALLFRSADFWQGLPPGETGHVLTLDGLNPIWAPPSGGGVGRVPFRGATISPTPTASGTAGVVKASWFECLETCTVTSVTSLVSTASLTPQHKGFIARTDGFDVTDPITELLAITPYYSQTATSGLLRDMPLAEPVTLLAGQTYLIGDVNFAAAVSATNPVRLNRGDSSDWIPNAPLRPLQGGWNAQTFDPDVGTLPSAITNSAFCLTVSGFLGLPEEDDA